VQGEVPFHEGPDITDQSTGAMGNVEHGRKGAGNVAPVTDRVPRNHAGHNPPSIRKRDSLNAVGREDGRLQVGVPRHAGNSLDDGGGENVARIVVRPPLAGREVRGEDSDLRNHLASGDRQRRGCGPERRDIRETRHTRRVIEQLHNGDCLRVREIRQEPGQRVFQIHNALSDEVQDTGRDNLL